MIYAKQNTGYSLIEVMVAIAILLLALVGPMSIASKSLKSASYAKERGTALFLAQEGIEGIIKVRNDYTIAGIHAGDLSTSWDWTTNPALAPCFAADGCNFDFAGTHPISGNQTTGFVMNDVVSCTNIEDCRLYFNKDFAHVPFTIDSDPANNDPTPFMRVVNVENVTAEEVKVTATVYWDAGIFEGTDLDSVTLETFLFKVY